MSNLQAADSHESNTAEYLPLLRGELLRLWLATPGGRPLVDDILERYVGLKPGQRPAGIVVEGMALTTPLEPE